MIEVVVSRALTRRTLVAGAATTLLNGQSRHRQSDLISELKRHDGAPELFAVADGINEFDIIWSEGLYYLAFHPYETPQPRIYRGPTAEGLAKAPSAPLPPIYYPTILNVGERWHAWGWNPSEGTEHWTAPAWDGPYSLSDRVPNTKNERGDAHVRRSPDGTFVLAYKYAKPTYWAGLLTAPSPDGPWKDLGPVFRVRGPWHAGEEADPAVHFARNGCVYMTFAAWNGDDRHIQEIGAVQLDRNLRPLGPARMIATPDQPWQQRNGSRKLFNPVLVERPGVTELFYSHNPSARGVTTGWGRFVVSSET